ncbi:MAG: long-chain fatty acid--CoA ligase [Gemmatimonadetes bacterium]|nr:long-chain fatty acid--CoA ligase [Gemmatimonadota bacterium]
MEERRWHRFYEEGVATSIDYDELTISDIFTLSAKKFASRPALTYSNRTLTYSQLENEVDRFATALSRMGVTRGSKVAIQLPNLPQTVISYYATMKLGAQAVMTNPLYTPREIEHQWNDSEATVAILMDFLYAQRVVPIKDRLCVKSYIVASLPEYMKFPLSFLARLKLKKLDPPMIAQVPEGTNVHHFRKLINSTTPAVPEVDVAMDDVAALQYTGGTTGVSKGAMLTHRNLSYNAQQIGDWNRKALQGSEVLLGCLPYFHIYGLTVSLNLPIYWGAHIVLMSNPRDIPRMVSNLVKYRVTLFPAVPAMYNAVNQYPGVDKLDLSSIKVCNSGSAPLPGEVLKRFEELTGGKITEGFGLTETSPVTHSNPVTNARKVGSVGVPLADTDARIVDLEDGITELPPGEKGELILKGPQIMKGYWKNPEATQNMIRDGWLYTGDIAYMDEDGFFFIAGRKKDMILVSGYNVYPDEIDRILVEHPAVLEAATIGIPDPKCGEAVKSFVVAKEGYQPDENELIDHCRKNLAAYKIPSSIEFRDQLPKSTVLKILRRQLREEEIAKAATN